MRKKLIFALILVNALLAAAFLATPADSQIFTMGIRNCCKEESPGESYCCRGCCWFTVDCDGDEDCMVIEKVGRLP